MHNLSCLLLQLGIPFVVWLDVTSQQMNSQELDSDSQEEEIEEVVIGPFRVWHLVFLVVLFLLAVAIVVCCCIDIRIPRARQEIEDRYKLRQLYDRYGEKFTSSTPSNLQLRRKKKDRKRRSLFNFFRKSSSSDQPTTTTSTIAALPRMHHLSGMPKAGRKEEPEKSQGIKIKIMKGNQIGIETPLATSLGELLAITKSRQLSSMMTKPAESDMAQSMTTLKKP